MLSDADFCGFTFDHFEETGAAEEESDPGERVGRSERRTGLEPAEQLIPQTRSTRFGGKADVGHDPLAELVMEAWRWALLAFEAHQSLQGVKVFRRLVHRFLGI